MSASAPKIGLLDSGIGGLSVLREIHRQLPGIPTLYIADQAHLPYGSRPLDELHGYVDAMVRFLHGQGASIVVLACHAASAASLYRLRQTWPERRFVGIEPAIKPAVEQSSSHIVGVLTTQATAGGPLFRRVLALYAGQTRVITRVAPDLVTLAETGDPHTSEAERLIRAHVEPLVAAGADQIVLACTHFPFLAETIQRVAGPDVRLVDPGPAVARQVSRLLGAEAVRSGEPDVYYTTGSRDAFRAALQRLLLIDAPVTALRWSAHTAGELSLEEAT